MSTKFDRIFLTSFIIIFALCFAPLYLYAQSITSQEIEQLENWLVKNEIVNIELFLSSREAATTGNEPDSGEARRLQDLKNDYHRIILWLKSIETASPQQLQQWATQGRGKEAGFREAFTGKQAAAYYKSYLELADALRWHEAARSYFLAAHFKTRHLRNLRYSIENNIALADSKRALGEYEAALALVEETSRVVKGHFAFHQHRSELQSLKRRINKEWREADVKRRLYEQTDEIGYSWIISVAGRFAAAGPAYEISLNDPFGGFFLLEASNTYGPDVSLGISRMLSKTIELGIEISGAELSAKTIRTIPEWEEEGDYDVRNLMACMLGNLFMGSRVGARTRLGLGLGLERCELTNVSLIHYSLSTSGDPEYVPLLRAEAGVDYVGSVNSRLLISAFFGFQYLLKDPVYTGRYAGNGGIKLGFLF